MTTRLVMIAPLFATLSACIVYADKNKDDDPSYFDDGDRDDTEDSPDVGVDTGRVDTGRVDTATVDSGTADTDVVTGSFDLDPTSGTAGDTLLLGLTSTGAYLVDDIAGVELLGAAQVQVVTGSVFGDAYVVALTIPEGATPGAQDVLVRLDDGSAAFLGGSFEVLEAPADTNAP